MLPPILKRFVERQAERRGYRFVRNEPGVSQSFDDLDDDVTTLFERVKDYTMTTRVRVGALRDAVRHVVDSDIPGAIVECGVWRGGSMMAVALTLKHLGREDRDLYLYDTFEGMPAPGEEDVDVWGVSAQERQATAEAHLASGKHVPTVMQFLPYEGVRNAMMSTGYPAERLHFVPGLVEDTIPENAPESIAILRLDTDYYSSTKHELVHLYPRVSDGGLVLIDDYGRWKGSRQATDEYIAEQGVHVLLHRIDAASRMIEVRRPRDGV